MLGLFGSQAVPTLLGVPVSQALAQDESEEPKPPRYDPEPGVNEVIIDSPFEALELACIDEFNGRACFGAAQGWHEGRGIPRPDPGQAYHLYKAGCGFEYPPACTAAATMVLRAQAGFLIIRPTGILSLDFGEAARLVGIACTLGDAAACGLYGDIMIDPDGQLPNEATIHRNIRQDPLAARQAYMDGCPLPNQRDLGSVARDVRSCSRLAQLYEQGRAGLRKSSEFVLTYYRLGCEAPGGSELCVLADLLEADGLERDEQPTNERVRRRTTIQPRRPAPDTSRFRDSPDALIDHTGQDAHHRRFDLTLGLGGRWTYGSEQISGMKLRLGGVAWFNMVGIAFDTGFTTDRFARIYDRTYLRFQQGLGPQLALPIPDRLVQPIDFRLVLGAGGTLGTVKRGQQGDFLLSYGLRQRIQLEIGTSRRAGARQWGALRFEQQQTWYTDTAATVEHSSQVVLVAGFTFGGLDVDWTPNVN
jgi:TPR repeat protein